MPTEYKKPEWLTLLEFARPRPISGGLRGLLCPSFNWQVLLELAERHGLIALLADRIKNLGSLSVPQNFRAASSEKLRAHSIFALQLTAELFRVLERFSAAGIQTLVTKGPALSVRCYGDPGMRQYGDLDLVLRESDIRRATLTMFDLGYQPRVPLSAIDAGKIPGEYAFRKPGTSLLVEFHTERTFRYHPRQINIERLFERRATLFIDGRNIPVLSLEDELVLICVHGAKHFWERLLWISDVAALVFANRPTDWGRALSVAREVGAGRILLLGLRLAADLLGADLPVQARADVESDRVVAKLAAQIEARLPTQETSDIGLLERAAFRIRMRGGVFAGVAYLLRLSLSPTEEDWPPGEEGNRPAFAETIRRPFRLAKKHGRRLGA